MSITENNDQIIYYETVGSKVHWKYKSYLQDDFEIIKLEDIWREEYYCYGVEQYILSFIEGIKEKVIRYLPNLKEVKMSICILDKDNLFHRLTISVMELISNMLNRKLKTIHYYKTIFIVIYYEGKNAFIGSLDFDKLV